MDTRTEAEKRYDAERDGSLYVKPTIALADADPSPVTVERHWADEDDNPDGPAAGSTAWFDYECGCVLIGVSDDTSHDPIDMHIHNIHLDGVPITLASLAQIYTDLGHLLSDPRLRAALPAGEPQATGRAPTRMVRVKKYEGGHSFALVLSVSIGAAVSRKAHELGITNRQASSIMMVAGDVVDAMFGVAPGDYHMESSEAIDLAYRRGYRDALTDVTAFVGLRERDPEKARELVIPSA